MAITGTEEDRAIAQFEERMKEKRKFEEEAEKLKADRLRHEYLKRTGRTEMKPE